MPLGGLSALRWRVLHSVAYPRKPHGLTAELRGAVRRCGSLATVSARLLVIARTWGIPMSTLKRWRRWWLETLAATPMWRAQGGAPAAPPGKAPLRWLLHRIRGWRLIDATQWFRPLRKNLGKKNCELGEDDIERICRTFLDFEETGQSKIFDNDAFGHWKVTVERPLRIDGAEPERTYKPAEIKALKVDGERSEDAPPVIRKIHKRGVEADPIRGLFETTIDGKPAVVEYEPDSGLRDIEQIPLQEEGGIEKFLEREVLPYAADAWYKLNSVKIGYEISFTRYFYKPEPMRTMEEIQAEILALERETEGLLGQILGKDAA